MEYMLFDSKPGSHFLNIIFSIHNFSVSLSGEDWQKSEVEGVFVKMSGGLGFVLVLSLMSWMTLAKLFHLFQP